MKNKEARAREQGEELDQKKKVLDKALAVGFVGPRLPSCFKTCTRS